jgi:S-formylglutathione hydrolase FrmB
MTVVLPQATQAQVGVTSARDSDGDGPPVLYLLHGMSDDHTAWLRYTSIERYAAAAGLAVVMPAAARSFYTDEAQGHAFWALVADELPEIVSSFFRVSTRPERTYVAGLSMGGYGAVKLALARPRQFAGAASLSGALDIVRRAEEPVHREEMPVASSGVRPGRSTTCSPCSTVRNRTTYLPCTSPAEPRTASSRTARSSSAARRPRGST